MTRQTSPESGGSRPSIQLESRKRRARDVLLGVVAFAAPATLAFRGYLTDDFLLILFLGYVLATAILDSWLMMGVLIALLLGCTIPNPSR